LALALVFIPNGEGFPTFDGRTDIDATIRGNWKETEKWNVQFNGTAREVRINDNPFGDVRFSGVTENSVLNANLTAIFDARPQIISATLN
ncbi:hypothetical protein OFB78_30150, partial [Escherichia coli]|nr:hypothetical protein [Escherichia coli]